MQGLWSNDYRMRFHEYTPLNFGVSLRPGMQGLWYTVCRMG